jgi:hypothetical protein
VSGISVSAVAAVKRLIPAAALLGLLGAVMISSVTATPKQLFLDCKVSGTMSGIAADFDGKFCSALATALERDLQVAVSREAAGQELGVRVRLTIRSPYRAEVSISSTGKVEGQGIAVTRTATSALSSVDRELSAGSARTLVYPIATQLGLAK